MDKLKVGDLVSFSDGQLTDGLYRLCGSERAIVVEQLIYLAEVERRSLYLELGYSSMFELCRRFLGHIKSKAYRRSTAARPLARFPVVADHLRDGRLCVTTLAELRDVLVEDRLDEILTRAAGKTEEEVKELVAALRPQPAPPELFRRLPAPATPPSGPAQPVFEHAVPAENRVVVTERPPGKIEPISEELRVLRITVGKEFADDLTRARAAFGGDIAQVLHHGLRVALEVHERKRRGTGRAKRGGSKGHSHSRYVPAHVRDTVWRRDEGRCAFVGPTGVRCAATERLHMHHIIAHALGGKPTVENLSLRCAPHNRHHAVKDFGSKHVARAIEGARNR